MNPLITVIIPTYNGARFLGEAIESIRANHYDPLEILVIDDASSDATIELARKWIGAANVQSHAHSGRPAVGRNRGIQLARGEVIAFLDQDDVWTVDKLARQLVCFAARPALQVIWGHTQRLQENPDGSFAPFGAPLDYRLVSSALFRKTVFEQVGEFDAELRYLGDDLDWYLRACNANIPMDMLDTVTLYWRFHAANTSHTAEIRNHAQGYDHALTEVLKKSLQRKREQNRDRS